MKALILAAGKAIRLHPLTMDLPKCLLALHGKPIVLHQIDMLQACGINEITIVTGFGAEKIRNTVGSRANYVHYADFASTNNMSTLLYNYHLLSGDLVLLFSDVLLPYLGYQRCIHSATDCGLIIDSSQKRLGTMRIRLNGILITDIGPHISVARGHGNFVGIAKFSARGAELLASRLEEMLSQRFNSTNYYIDALTRLATEGHKIEGVFIDGFPWIEVDTYSDYMKAQHATFYLANK